MCSQEAEALQALTQSPVDAVLTDIGLSGLTGYDVDERIRQQRGLARSRLVAITGYGQATGRARSQQAGFDFHLVKPVAQAELYEVLRQVGE